MKNILIVSYHFPPDTAVGGIRVSKFAKYLPEFGWMPFVLTAKEKYYESTDQSRMSEIVEPDKVFRTNVWPDPSAVYLRIKRWWYCIRGREHIFDEKVNTYRRPEHVKTEGILERMQCSLISLAAVADGNLGWVPPATLRALLLMRRHKIDCLFTSGPPHATHIVGLALKLLYGTRWVAEFRDPWILNPTRAVSTKMKSGISEAIEKWMEKQIVTHADKVISVTGKMSQGFMELYPEIEKDKFATIPNGYDPEDFSGLPRPVSNGKFIVSYIGTFYLERTPSYFLKAIRELVTERKIPQKDLEIRFIGPSRYIDGRSIEEIVKDEGLISLTKIMDPLPYKQALGEMIESHVLLLLAPNQYYQIPAKTFEYMASAADIIALTSEGATADLLRETGCGVVVEPNSIQQIKCAIEACYQKYKSGNRQPRHRLSSRQDIVRYNRKALTGELVSLLE